MAYEGAGIRFTEQGEGARPQSPVQEAVQLLRLRIPRFAGAPPPAAPPGLLAGGASAPGAPGAATMPPALAQILQKVITALMQAGAAQTTSRPAAASAYSPSQVLQQMLQGQTFGQPGAGSLVGSPSFQFGQQQPQPTPPSAAVGVPSASPMNNYAGPPAPDSWPVGM